MANFVCFHLKLWPKTLTQLGLDVSVCVCVSAHACLRTFFVYLGTCVVRMCLLRALSCRYSVLRRPQPGVPVPGGVHDAAGGEAPSVPRHQPLQGAGPHPEPTGGHPPHHGALFWSAPSSCAYAVWCKWFIHVLFQNLNLFSFILCFFLSSKLMWIDFDGRL